MRLSYISNSTINKNKLINEQYNIINKNDDIYGVSWDFFFKSFAESYYNYDFGRKKKSVVKTIISICLFI
jgi:hypothetical protein